MPTIVRGVSNGENNTQTLIYICMNRNTSFKKKSLTQTDHRRSVFTNYVIKADEVNAEQRHL